MILVCCGTCFLSIFRCLAILLPICECILSSFVPCIHSSLKLSLLIGWAETELLQSQGLISAIKWLKIHLRVGERMT